MIPGGILLRSCKISGKIHFQIKILIRSWLSFQILKDEWKDEWRSNHKKLELNLES